MIKGILKFYGTEQKEHPLTLSIGMQCNISHSVISQFLNLIDCPEDGRCLQYMRPVCEYLLNSYFIEHHLQIAKGVIKAQNKIWEAIRIVAINNDLFSKPSMPTKANNPIYAFHFDVSPYTPSNPKYKAPSKRTYLILAAFLHKRMNHWFNLIELEEIDIKKRPI